jgi:hypothetical protein
MLNIQKYGASQRAIIHEHLQSAQPITRSEAEIALKQGETVFAVFSTDIVHMIPYTPIQQVDWIRLVSKEERNWLNQYWKEHYELDLKQIKQTYHYVVGLILGNDVYTFPECLIIIFTKPG